MTLHDQLEGAILHTVFDLHACHLMPSISGHAPRVYRCLPSSHGVAKNSYSIRFFLFLGGGGCEPKTHAYWYTVHRRRKMF